MSTMSNFIKPRMQNKMSTKQNTNAKTHRKSKMKIKTKNMQTPSADAEKCKPETRENTQTPQKREHGTQNNPKRQKMQTLNIKKKTKNAKIILNTYCT